MKIELLKAGTEVGTITSSVSIGSSGKGSCTWPIYPTGSTGSDYKSASGASASLLSRIPAMCISYSGS